MSVKTITAPSVALSIRQPWAYLLATGVKIYETRSRRTSHRGPIAIHASNFWTVRMAKMCYQEPFFPMLSALGIRFPARCNETRLITLGLDFGSVIAVGELVDCVLTESLLPSLGPREIAFGDFSHDRWAYVYDGMIRLAEPVPCQGRLGIFSLTDAVVGRIKDQLAKGGGS